MRTPFYDSNCWPRRTENTEPGADLLSFDFDDRMNSTNDRRSMEFDLPMFSYSSVSAATNNFSPQNKLGEGGFGPVYKVCTINYIRCVLYNDEKKERKYGK